jgi:hypothetical protein
MADDDTSYLYEDLYGGAEDGIPGLGDSSKESTSTGASSASAGAVVPPPSASPSGQPQPIATVDTDRAFSPSVQNYEQRGARFQGPYTPPVGGVRVSRDSEERPVNVRPSDMPDEGQVFFFHDAIWTGFSVTPCDRPLAGSCSATR